MATKKLKTVCPYDCPNGCGILATVETDDINSRVGKKVICVEGQKDHPRTNGYLCRKMQHYEEIVNSPDRLLYPMKRIGRKGEGIFTRITWEEALSEIKERWTTIIETDGAEAIYPFICAGVMGALQKNCTTAFFRYLGASKDVGSLCAEGRNAGFASVMGTTNGLDAAQMEDADLILVWGCNMAATQLHNLPYLKRAKEKGADIILIDTYKHAGAAYCTETVLLHPGSDAALALAVTHVLDNEGLADEKFLSEKVYGVEEFRQNLPEYTPAWAKNITGVDEETIRHLAALLGKAKKPVVMMGGGPSRSGNGAMGVRCVLAMLAFVGAWDKGGGMSGAKLSGKWIAADKVARPDFEKTPANPVSMYELGNQLGRAKSLYVSNCNPANVLPDQKKVLEEFAREDLFMVVHERFLTDTAKYADIVLPCTFSTEQDDLFTPYGYNGVQWSRAVAEAPGEARSNWNTACAMAEAMGFEDPYFKQTEEEFCRNLLEELQGEKMTEEEYEAFLEGTAIVKPISTPPVFGTPSGRMQLIDENAKDSLVTYTAPYGGDEPLKLSVGPSLYSLNSTFAEYERMERQRGPMRLKMNPADASLRGIKDGDIVVAKNELAEVEFFAEVTEDVLGGNVIAEGIYTKRQSLNGLTVNALFHQRVTDLGLATTMNDNTVEVFRK